MILVLAAATLSELCHAAPPPAAPPDAAESTTYAAVGDDARAKDDLTIAVTAYRKALALDPHNQHAAEALRAICAASPDDDAIVLAAMARYHRGDRDGARAALAKVTTPTPAAHLLRGLIALEEHDRATAEAELAIARRDPAYARLAGDLLRLARRDGMIATTLLVAPEIDSNPQQLPDTPPMNATTGLREADTDLLVAGAVTYRPVRALALRNVLAWRNQRELDALDFVGETAQATLELDRGPNRADLRYDFDYDLLAGERYLLAHRGTLELRHDRGSVELAASLSLRRRDYQQAAQAGFTGWVYGGEAGVVVHAGEIVDVEAKLVVARERTADPIFGFVDGGAHAGVRLRPASRVRIAAHAVASVARYDAPEPDGVRRRDLELDAVADVEIDLADHLILVGGATGTRLESTVEDFDYWKVVARCGLVFAIGGP